MLLKLNKEHFPSTFAIFQLQGIKSWLQGSVHPLINTTANMLLGTTLYA